MDFSDAPREKIEDTFESKYGKIVKSHIGADTYLKLLEKDNRFGDIVFRFSNGGKTYNLHRVILFAALGIELSDQVITETLNKAPLNASLEDFVLGLIYGAVLPEKYPFSLVDTLRIFVRSFEI